MSEREWSGQSAPYPGGTSTSASDLKGRVQETASRLGQSAVEAAEAGRSAAARGIQSTVDGIRSASEHLPGGPRVRDFANRTADNLDRGVQYLRERQAKDMWMDIQEGAKARPVPFLVGAVAIGFVAGRLLRRG